MSNKSQSYTNKKETPQRGSLSGAKTSDAVPDLTRTVAAFRRIAAGPRLVGPSDVLILQRAIGNRAVQRLLNENVERRPRPEDAQASSTTVQRRMQTSVPPLETLSQSEDAEEIRRAAERGRQTPASELPFAGQIQKSFGHHDIGGVAAHLGPEASASAEAMNAEAYATAGHVVFAGRPTLHTAAHEAAHVVQQRAGVRLARGVGEAGDLYERQADEVAERVAEGRSAQDLLDRFAGGQDDNPDGASRPDGDDSHPSSTARESSEDHSAVRRSLAARTQRDEASAVPRLSRIVHTTLADAPVQRVAVRRSGADRDTMRDHFVRTGVLNAQSITQLDQQVGSTNVLLAGVQNVDLLLRNDVTIPQLAAVFAGIAQADVPNMFTRAGALEVGLYKKLAVAPGAVIQDFFALPLAPAATAPQIDTWFGNYLLLPNAPAAYDVNEYTNFQNQMIGPPRRYRDIAANAWRTFPDAYDQYVRQNAAPNLTMANVAAAIYNGQNLDWDTGQLGNVPAWNAAAANTITRQVLTLINNGLTMVDVAYTAAMRQALDIVSNNVGATVAMGLNPARMRVFLTMLSVTPDVRLFQSIQIYMRHGIDQALSAAHQLAPVWTSTWELAFAQDLDGLHAGRRTHVVNWINGGAGRLNTLRGHFHVIDAGAAPDFAATWQAAGRVFTDNRPQLPTFLENAQMIMVAVPHEHDVNRPYGNRGTPPAVGLDGHFKKHVLGFGNIDIGEPQRWFNHLNLVGQVTRAHLAGLSPAEELAIFGANAIGGATVLSAPQAALLIAQCQAGGMVAPANALAALYANDYHQAVSNAYDNADGSYIFWHGGRVKINTYHTASNIFAVAGWDTPQARFDFSSGYIPQGGAGSAQAKWQLEYALRLWEHQ